MQADAADEVLHVDAVAAVHPGGDKVRASPGIARVVAHPLVVRIPVDVWVRECLGELHVGFKAKSAVSGDGSEGLIVDTALVSTKTPSRSKKISA